MKLSDLVDFSEIQKMVEANYNASGVPNGIVDAIDGEILAGAGWQDICLNFHRANEQSRQLCIESDLHITNKVKDGTSCAYKCAHGIWDIGIPIMVDGQHLATLFLGQFLYDDEEPDLEAFKAQAAKYGFDEADYLQTLENLPRFSHAKVEQILEYNRALARFIGELASKNQELETRVDERTAQLQQVNRQLSYENRGRRLTTEKLRKEKEFTESIIQSSAAFFVAIDDHGRTILMNDAMLAATGYSRDEVIGQDYVSRFIPADDRDLINQVIGKFKRGESTTINENHILTKAGHKLLVEWHGRPMFAEQGELEFFFGVGIDITDKRLYENERESLISELKDALESVKVMSGLLPICAECKNIRDDQGYWNRIEAYIESHSDALFSHSLCPDCAKKLYGNEPWFKG